MLDTSEDDVDADFPPLEPTDPIHKYEFDSLALVEQANTGLDKNQNQDIPQVLVFIHMTQGISTFRFPANTQLSAVVERAVVRRHLKQHGGYEYHLESWPSLLGEQHQQQSVTSNAADGTRTRGTSQQLCQGQRLDFTLRLSDVIAAGLPLRFVLRRENSRSDPVMVASSDDEEDSGDNVYTNAHIPSENSHTAFQLRQYSVTFLKGLFPREVRLNVSKDGIKLDQVNIPKRPKLFSQKTKPIAYGVHTLADCELLSSGSTSTRSSSSDGVPPNLSRVVEIQAEPPPTPSFVTGKTQFRIVYLAHKPDPSASSDVVVASQVPTTTATNSGQRPAVQKHDNLATEDGSPPVFQQLCFETQWARARAICNQLNLILECSGSRARQLYMQRRVASEK